MDDLFLTKREAQIFFFNFLNFPTALSSVAMLSFHLKLVAGIKATDLLLQ